MIIFKRFLPISCIEKNVDINILKSVHLEDIKCRNNNKHIGYTILLNNRSYLSENELLAV